MERRNYRQLVGALSMAMGLIGTVTLGSLPGRAQTTPNTSPSRNAAPAPGPSGVGQPSNVTPGVGQPGVGQPTIQQPGVGQPGVGQPNIQQPGQQPNVQQQNPAAPDPIESANTEDQSLTELLQQISQTGSFNTLAQAVQAANLSGTLRESGGRYTIFAPTDEAFAALPQGTLEKLLQPENRALLQQVLAYHVVPNELMASDLQTGAVDTIGGGIAVRVTPERVIVNDGSVIRSDIPAANGVVHVVNRVLMPAELRQRLDAL